MKQITSGMLLDMHVKKHAAYSIINGNIYLNPKCVPVQLKLDSSQPQMGFKINVCTGVCNVYTDIFFHFSRVLNE